MEAKTIIKIYDKIGREGRSRINASKLNISNINPASAVILDFKEVDFLSRSFTDEIISQLCKRNYSLVNANSIITNMFHAVEEGLKKPRIHNSGNYVMKCFDSMVELSRYLNSGIKPTNDV